MRQRIHDVIDRDRQALLRAIRDSPDDDLPRLAFADLLEENGGDEHAEFIRHQIELARYEVPMVAGKIDSDVCGPYLPVEYTARGTFYSDKKASYHVLHADRLLGKENNRVEWAGWVGPPEVVLSGPNEEYEYGSPITFHRGFVRSVWAPFRELMDQDGDLWEHPIENIFVPGASPVRTVSQRWGWGLPEDYRGAIPEKVWDELIVEPGSAGRRSGWSTSESALFALSDAILKCMRRRTHVV